MRDEVSTILIQVTHLALVLLTRVHQLALGQGQRREGNENNLGHHLAKEVENYDTSQNENEEGVNKVESEKASQI